MYPQPVTPSIRRVIQNFRSVGLKREPPASGLVNPSSEPATDEFDVSFVVPEAWRDLQYIGDTKAGRLVGSDE